MLETLLGRGLRCSMQTSHRFIDRMACLHAQQRIGGKAFALPPEESDFDGSLKVTGNIAGQPNLTVLLVAHDQLAAG